MLPNPNSPASEPVAPVPDVEQPCKKKDFEITINPDCQSSLLLNTWPINVHPDEFGIEGERVSVKRGNKHYALVFYDGEVYVEISEETDANGTLKSKKTIDITDQ